MGDSIKEEVLVSVVIDKAEAGKQVDSLLKSITALKTQNADLAKTNKELEKSGKANTKEYIDNAKQIEINKQKITENTASRKSLITTITAEDNSIKALQARNRELIKQRNEISTATEEGRAKIALLNTQIDKNNEVIRTNVSGLEKQKINIGNYASALDNVIPGLSKYVQGTQAMTVASNTFIATPIGAIIGAIGLALAALIAYFKGSEEGQNRLNRIMNIGGAIMEKLMDVVEGFGKTIFEAFENPKQAALDLVNFLKDNIINRFTAFAVILDGIVNLDFEKVANGTIQLTTGIENGLTKLKEFGQEVSKQADDAFARAEALSILQERLNKQEREILVSRAKAERDVAKLFVESQSLEGDARLKKLNEAIAIEGKILEMEKSIAATRLAIAKQTVEDDPTIENKKAYAEAVAAQYKAELDFFNGIRRLDKQRVTAEEEIKKQQADADEAEKERLTKLLEEHFQNLEAKAQADKEYHDGLRLLRERNSKEEEEAAAKALQERLKELDSLKALRDAKISVYAAIGNAISGLAGKNKVLAIAGILIEKAAALAQIISNTAIANAKAIATSFATFGQPWVAINTGTAIASGIAVAAQAAQSIQQISGFAKGGRADKRGTFEGPSHAGGGVTYIRSDGGHAIEVEGGENFYVLKRSASQEINSLSRLNQAHGGRSWTPTPSFDLGGNVSHFAEGGFAGMQATRVASQQITMVQLERAFTNAMRQLPPIVATIEDINAGLEQRMQILERANIFSR